MVVKFWKSALLEALPWCRHGVTLRTAGVSAPPFSSLNGGLHVGDDPDAVRENRRRTARALGADSNDMVCAAQVHGSRTAVVTARDRGRGASEFEGAIAGADALVTADSDVLLTLFFADCVPLLLCDVRLRVVGVVHAGWRGAVAGVAENAVAAMVTGFGSRTADIVAAIGPGIGPCCFAVGEEVAEQFPAAAVRRTGAQCTVDLPGFLRDRLAAVGVSPDHIETCGDCTSCRTDRYFSHRRENGVTGRIAALIGIRA